MTEALIAAGAFALMGFLRFLRFFRRWRWDTLPPVSGSFTLTEHIVDCVSREEYDALLQRVEALEGRLTLSKADEATMRLVKPHAFQRDL